MQNTFAMRIIDRPRDLGDQPHALVRPILQPGRSGQQTPAGRVFHAEEGKAILAFTDLVDRQDIGMIELRRRFRFASKPNERLVRAALVGKDALEGHNAAGVPLARTVNDTHAATPDFLQNLIVSEPPMRVGDFRFREDTLEGFSGGLSIGFQSLTKKTICAETLANARGRAALSAFASSLECVRGRVLRIRERFHG